MRIGPDGRLRPPRFGVGFRQYLAAVILSGVFASLTSAAQDAPIATLKSDTQMVVLAVIARDKDGRFVRDLQQQDLLVLDEQVAQSLASFRLVDRGSSLDTNMIPLLGASSSCSSGWRPNFYYELTYYPSEAVRKGGYHHVVINSKRRHLVLTHRRGYFAAQPANTPRSERADGWQPDSQLTQAACNSIVPSQSQLLQARLVRPQSKKEHARFSLGVEPQLLSFGTEGESEGVDFQLAACAFDPEGTPVRYFEERIRKALAAEQLSVARKEGVAHSFSFPIPPTASSSRFIVRDTRSGRMGTVDLSMVAALQALRAKPAGVPSRSDWRYFGSPVPSEDSFCGEVGPFIGDRFDGTESNGAPLGVLYTPFLDTHDQYDRNYLPGLGATNLFQITYYGKFWVDIPGRYTFKLISDDGARVYIDDVEVANNDGIHIVSEVLGQVVLEKGEHFIRVPYYEGNPTEVALQLFIAPPGGKFKIFDLRDYSTSGRFHWAFVQPDIRDEITTSQTETYCRKLVS